MTKLTRKMPGLMSVVAEFCLLACLMLAVPVSVYTDIVVLDHGLRDDSLTEHLQEALLLLSAILIGISAWKRPGSRGFLVLVAGLFAAMFIRENDSVLDTVAHGFWVYPALLVSVCAIIYAARLRGTVLEPMLDYASTKPMAYLVIGLLLVIVFSRTFGTQQLWSHVMGEDYRRLYKSVIQEGLELLGYVLVFCGSLLVMLLGEVHGENPARAGDRENPRPPAH